MPLLRGPDRVGALVPGRGGAAADAALGHDLNEGKAFLTLAPWVSLFPGAFNVLGDGLRDALDPRAEMR